MSIETLSRIYGMLIVHLSTVCKPIWPKALGSLQKAYGPSQESLTCIYRLSIESSIGDLSRVHRISIEKLWNANQQVIEGRSKIYRGVSKAYRSPIEDLSGIYCKTLVTLYENQSDAYRDPIGFLCNILSEIY